MTPKTTPKDFFLHLAALIALYITVPALLSLIFAIINYLAPDQLAGYFTAHSIAWPISILIILVPILYVLEWVIIKDVRENSEKKNIWIWRWRIYLTLFLAGAAIAVDLVTLINTYLGGEISARFIYKVLAVIVVSGAVFKYYFFSINEKYKLAKIAKQGSIWGGIILVIAAIIGGFLVVGSPAKQRALRFDDQRVSDLQNIQYQVRNYWQQKGKLPTVLSDLNDSLSYMSVPNDPENKKMYEYTMKGGASFELCANFALATENTSGKGGYYNGSIAYPMYPDGANENWKHETGRTCFTRTIDPELYPVNSKTAKPL